MRRDAKANLIALIVLVGFALSVVFHYVRGVYYGLPYPHNTFLFSPGDRFADFYALLDWNRNLNPYLRATPTAQYPLLNLLSFALSAMGTRWSYELFHAIVTIALLWLTGISLNGPDKTLVCLRTTIIALLTYPYLFTIDRGNFESLLCVWLLIFAYCYQRGHTKTAAFFLAGPIAMKLFPVVLLVLLVSDRKYLTAVQSVLWTAALTLVSTAMFAGGLHQNLQVLLSGRNLAANSNVATFTSLSPLVQRGVSLLSVFKILLCEFGKLHAVNAATFMRTYALTMVALFLLIALYVLIIERQLWKKVTILVFVMLLFPQISADYKLMHILIPLLLFVNAPRRGKLDAFYTLGFGLLLIPKDYVLLKSVYSDASARDLSIGMLLNPAIMILMMIAIIATGVCSARWWEIREVIARHWYAFTRPVRLIRIRFGALS